MVSTFASNMSGMVKDLLSQYGDPVGNIRLLRVSPGAIDPTNPSAGPVSTTTEYESICYLYDAEVRDEDGTTRSETKVIMAADSIDVVPKDTDKIKVMDPDGASYTVYNIMRVKRTRISGSVIAYTLTLED